MKKRIVIKIGSNVLTRKDGKLDVTRMSALVDQIAWLRKQDIEVILVSSGAVACGRRELTVDHTLDSVEQRQLFSAVGQVKLVGLYYDLFREFGIHVGQVLTMKENFQPGEQYKNQQACMTVMLENNVLPIVNENDTVSVTELMFTDNDELSGLIAQMMKADTLILPPTLMVSMMDTLTILRHPLFRRWSLVATCPNTSRKRRVPSAVAACIPSIPLPAKFPKPASVSSSQTVSARTSSSIYKNILKQPHIPNSYHATERDF